MSILQKIKMTEEAGLWDQDAELWESLGYEAVSGLSPPSFIRAIFL
jgi:hypothetical protein